MNARIRLTWTRSPSSNLSRQTLEVVAAGTSWGESDVGLNEITDILAPENTSLQFILRSYNQANRTGDSATVTASFTTPAYGEPMPPPEEPLTDPASNFQVQQLSWE